MPRERRIGREGAICDVMARGDGREDMAVDGKDGARFEETLEEVVEKKKKRNGSSMRRRGCSGAGAATGPRGPWAAGAQGWWRG